MLVPNLIVSISAPPKSGKTHLAMTFPEPIKVFSFDRRADFVRTKFPDKQIDIKNIILPIIESTNPDPWALPIWRDFYQEYKDDINSGKYQTMVLDPFTCTEELCRQAVFEEIQVGSMKDRAKMAPTEYLGRNIYLSSLFSHPRTLGVNLVVTQYVKDEWKKKPGAARAEPTGNVIADGWARTEGQADVILEMESVTLGEGTAAKTIMRTTIKGNGFDRDLNGKTFDDTTYDEIMALLGV